MEKSILKKFATESRKLLMSNVENQLNKYRVEEQFEKTISGDLIILKNDKYTLAPMTQEEYNCRERLVKRIKNLSDNNDIKTGIKRVIEESAYTWFNRIIAIRYMEVNDMLPLTKDNQSLNIRVLSSKDSFHPEILKMNNLTNSLLDLNIDFNVYSKLTTENEQFNYVLKKVCNKLGKIIPQIFDGYTEYINLLLPDNLLLNNGFVNKLITELDEDNYKSVEIIGWLYQYYNQDEKDRVMSLDSTNGKDEIPYVTQLFTPDWIVKYMVENSLGSYALEHGYSESLKNNWKYYVDSELDKKDIIKPTEIKFIDPCCGSGHILVYAFEVLMQIYKDYGYNTSDIPELILKNNLYGLDIDDRAGQLSILSVLLKAREYDSEIFNKVKDLNIMSMQESNGIDLSMFPEDLITQSDISYLIDTFKNAKEIGSLLNVEPHDYSMTLSKLENNIFDLILSEQLRPLIKQSEILSQKYDVVVTNPPYMGLNNFDKILYNYINNYFDDYKNDLYCSCIGKFKTMIKEDGILSMITQQSFMFNSRYKKARYNFLTQNSCRNMLYLGPHAFDELSGEVVQTVAFQFNNKNETDIETKFIDVRDGMSEKEKEELFILYKDKVESENVYFASFSNFLKIDSFNMSYWLSDGTINILTSSKNLSDIGKARHGLVTGNIDKFSKNWYEVNYNDISFETTDATKTIKKWYPYSNGGHFRRWYGNRISVVNWENDGLEIRNYKENGKIKSSNYNDEVNFKPSITWTDFSTSLISCRYSPAGELFDTAGPSYFLNNQNNIYNILGLMNSNLGQKFLYIYKTGIHYSAGAIEHIPFYEEILNDKITILVKKCIEISKIDWDSFEVSFDFKKSNLVNNHNYLLKESVKLIKEKQLRLFEELKENEENLNKIINKIYQMELEIDNCIDDKNISLSIQNELEIIKSLISYFVGCLFGRYSLDEEGLIFAGGEFDINRYNKFKPDVDNIIPITDTEYFKDDIVSKFKEFLCIAFSEETLNENMDYIAEVLGKKSRETSEDTIRRYFVNDFFKDHIQTYQKKPIYWLLDSGKKNGFKALFYLHRYDKDLISRVRLDYIGKIQTIYENRLKEIENDLNSSLELSTYEVKQLEKEQTGLYEKLEEVKKYYVKLSTIGDKNIELDLDDGVTENYKLFSYVDPETNEESSILGEAKVIAPKKK